MNVVKKNLNKIIGGIVILIIITFIYNHFFKDDISDFATSREILVIEETNEVSREILRTLDNLKKIEIDADFFNEDLSQSGNLVSFNELIDFSKAELQPKRTGKNNPFAFGSGGAKTTFSSEDETVKETENNPIETNPTEETGSTELETIL